MSRRGEERGKHAEASSCLVNSTSQMGGWSKVQCIDGHLGNVRSSITVPRPFDFGADVFPQGECDQNLSKQTAQSSHAMSFVAISVISKSAHSSVAGV